MKTLNASDKIFATVKYAGQTLLDKSYTGIDSIQTLLDCIRRELDGFVGFVILKLRNGSQGWAREQGLKIGASRPRKKVEEAVQLSLF